MQQITVFSFYYFKLQTKNDRHTNYHKIKNYVLHKQMTIHNGMFADYACTVYAVQH